MDSTWQEQLFGDGKLDAWLTRIRERCAPIRSAGLEAYAQTVMQQVFASTEDGRDPFPAVLYELVGSLDSIALCAALDIDLDLQSLEKLSSRICVGFLCNTVLLPRLRADPAAFPEPHPTEEEISEALAYAFEVHAEGFQQRLMKISELRLDKVRSQKLHRLLRAADLHGWMEENADQVDWLGPRRQEFVNLARACLSAPLANGPLAFPLTCLLKVYQSYPQNLEQQVAQLQRRVDNPEPGRDSARDGETLALRRSELHVQRQLWQADVAFVRRSLLKISTLGASGKNYLFRQLYQLALAEYRPRIGALNLRTVLRHASRQQEPVVELNEPDQ